GVAISGALGFRSDQQLPARRLHDPDAPSGNGSLLEAFADPQGATLVQVRHASCPLGAAARCQAFLRALCRNLASLDLEYRGGEELARLDEADPSEPDGLFDARAHSDAADDEGRGVPEGAHRFSSSSSRGSRGSTTGFLAARSPAPPGRSQELLELLPTLG